MYMPHKDARCRGLQVPPSHGRVGVGGKKTCTHHLAFGWAEASSPPLLLALLTPSAKPLCLGVPDAEAPDAGASRRWPLLRAESEVAGAPIGRERSTPVSTIFVFEASSCRAAAGGARCGTSGVDQGELCRR